MANNSIASVAPLPPVNALKAPDNDPNLKKVSAAATWPVLHNTEQTLAAAIAMNARSVNRTASSGAEAAIVAQDNATNFGKLERHKFEFGASQKHVNTVVQELARETLVATPFTKRASQESHTPKGAEPTGMKAFLSASQQGPARRPYAASVPSAAWAAAAERSAERLSNDATQHAQQATSAMMSAAQPRSFIKLDAQNPIAAFIGKLFPNREHDIELKGPVARPARDASFADAANPTALTDHILHNSLHAVGSAPATLALTDQRAVAFNMNAHAEPKMAVKPPQPSNTARSAAPAAPGR